MTRYILLFLLSANTCLAEEPTWIYTLKPSNHEIIGYGIDADLKVARQNALSDISQIISTEVSSSLESKKQLKNDKFNIEVNIIISTQSKSKLSGTKIIKSEQIDGLWYVAIGYDQSVIEVKMRKQLFKIELKNESQNKFFANSALFKRLNKEVGYTLDYKIIRLDDLWYLRYKDIHQQIGQEELLNLFSFNNGKNLSFKANKKIYYPGEKMYFDVSPKKTGYISILYIESNGKVGVLLDNQKVNNKFRYPDNKSEEELIIANPYKKTISEMYIAIHTEQLFDLRQFEAVDGDYLDDSNYNFPELAESLNNVDFSTVIVKIRY